MITTPDPYANAWRAVRLTPLEDADVGLVHDWHNNPAIRDLTMGFRFPVDREAVAAWIADARRENGRTKAVYGVRRDDTLVGIVQLRGIDAVQRKASFGLLIGETSERRSGLGYVATALIVDYAFNALDLARVSLDVLAGNDGAVRLYERLGFVREGLKRQDYYVDGARHDVLLYGLLRDDWKVSIPTEARRLVGSVGARQP